MSQDKVISPDVPTPALDNALRKACWETEGELAVQMHVFLEAFGNFAGEHTVFKENTEQQVWREKQNQLISEALKTLMRDKYPKTFIIAKAKELNLTADEISKIETYLTFDWVGLIEPILLWFFMQYSADSLPEINWTSVIYQLMQLPFSELANKQIDQNELVDDRRKQKKIIESLSSALRELNSELESNVSMFTQIAYQVQYYYAMRSPVMHLPGPGYVKRLSVEDQRAFVTNWMAAIESTLLSKKTEIFSRAQTSNPVWEEGVVKSIQAKFVEYRKLIDQHKTPSTADGSGDYSYYDVVHYLYTVTFSYPFSDKARADCLTALSSFLSPSIQEWRFNLLFSQLHPAFYDCYAEVLKGRKKIASSPIAFDQLQYLYAEHLETLCKQRKGRGIDQTTLDLAKRNLLFHLDNHVVYANTLTFVAILLKHSELQTWLAERGNEAVRHAFEHLRRQVISVDDFKVHMDMHNIDPNVIDTEQSLLELVCMKGYCSLAYHLAVTCGADLLAPYKAHGSGAGAPKYQEHVLFIALKTVLEGCSDLLLVSAILDAILEKKRKQENMTAIIHPLTADTPLHAVFRHPALSSSDQSLECIARRREALSLCINLLDFALKNREIIDPVAVNKKHCRAIYEAALQDKAGSHLKIIELFYRNKIYLTPQEKEALQQAEPPKTSLLQSVDRFEKEFSPVMSTPRKIESSGGASSPRAGNKVLSFFGIAKSSPPATPSRRGSETLSVVSDDRSSSSGSPPRDVSSTSSSLSASPVRLSSAVSTVGNKKPDDSVDPQVLSDAMKAMMC